MIKSPSRPREFSQFRNSPSRHTISRRTFQPTPTQSQKQLTPHKVAPTTYTPATPTPARPRTAFNQTNMTTVPRNNPAACSHGQHLCVNCINKCLIKQHQRKRTREQQREKSPQVLPIDPRDEQRRLLQQHFKEQQVNQLKQTQNQKQRQKELEQLQKRRQNEKQRELQREELEEQKRKEEAQRNKREQFKRELERQVEEERDKRRRDRDRQKEDMNTEAEGERQREILREQHSAKLLADYHIALKEQIKDNAERHKRELEQKREFQKRQLQAATFAPKLYTPTPIIHVQPPPNIQQRKQQSQANRQRLHQESLLAQQQYERQLKIQAERNHAKIQSYMRDLQQQIKNNQQRKQQRKLQDKKPQFQETEEQRVPMGECEGCHVKVPERWLGVYDCQQEI